MLAPPIVRVAGPVVETPAPPPGFPVIASAAPLVVAIVLFAVTGSPFMLLMGVFGPVIALATLLDGRRQRRRAARLAAARLADAVASAREQVALAHDAERRRLAGFAGVDAAWTTPDDPVVIAVSRGVAPSGVELIGSQVADEPRELEHVRTEAPRLRGAPLLRAVDAGFAIDGPPVLAAAVARTLALRIAARFSPASTTCEVPPGEEWAHRLPHETTPGTPGRYRFVVGEREVLVGWDGQSAHVLDRVAAHDADATTRSAARRAATRLADVARAAGVQAPGAELPDRVAWSDLAANTAEVRSLSAPLGVATDGVAIIDLVADGPHAVVAGTTGAGKSELLVSWVLGMAAGRSPSDVSFVLVDFKGGAAFAPLAALPHVLGTLSDLDAALAHRAIESLRAEVRRREQALAEAGVRSIDELAGSRLARLVVVVDEFAALVAQSPELHALFADLAARGRSLGVHLVLCTQRPSGVVRDAVLANVAVRIALRVADRADSLGLVGDDAAARLPAHPRGRAVVVDGSGRRRTVQLALASASDVERVARASPRASAHRPWCDPLPALVPHDSLPQAEGIAFGLRDLPAEQRQPVAEILPRHGHVLVVGAPGSGTTTALEAIAAGAGNAARWAPADPVELWDVLADPSRVDNGSVVLVEDLDLLFARCPVDHAPDLAELVGRLAREGPARGIRLVAAVQRLAGVVHGLAPLFGSRLLLRLGTREDHVLAGGDGASYDVRARPGAGTWEGAPVQVAVARTRPRATIASEGPVSVGIPDGGEIAVVASRPRDLLGLWDPADVRVRLLGEPESGEPSLDPGRTVLLGDPDAWHADWAALARARRDLPIVLYGCGVGDFRSITRSREAPPPLAPGEAWLVEGGRVRRALLRGGS